MQQIYKLRSSIALTYRNIDLDKIVIDFFFTDIRKNISIEFSSKKIYDILFLFDGKTTIQDIIQKISITNIEAFLKVIKMLNEQCILLEVDTEYNEYFRDNFKVFHFLENYYSKISRVNEVFLKIKNSTVMIIGLGAVGSFVADILLANGVENFILVDNDTVAISNLPRQSFFEKDIGKYKIDCIAEKFMSINSNVKIEKIHAFLDKDFFTQHNFNKIDLIINCADKPSVDTNSLIIGEYGIKNNIPHIIGGGYNFHISLIAQTVIPFKTACAKCLDTQLKEINSFKDTDMKRLIREERKIGSFLPLCNIASSIISMESIKILSDLDKYLGTVNTRKEFNAETLQIIDRMKFKKDPNCSWCSNNG